MNWGGAAPCAPHLAELMVAKRERVAFLWGHRSWYGIHTPVVDPYTYLHMDSANWI